MRSWLRAWNGGTEASQCNVLCLNIIPEFIIPIHIYQKMVLVSGRMLWRRCCVPVGSSGNEKQSARKVTLWRPVHNPASLRWGELLLNADNALPVSIVLDPGVRVVMRELRGRSGPATKTRDSDGGGGRITFVNRTRRCSLLLMYTSTCARAAWIHRRAMKGSDSMRHRCMGLWNTL